MVGFVLFKWSPIRVYDGDLGVFKQSDKIYALDDNLYIKLEGTELANRFKSHFVLVDRERALKENDLLDFTYQWGTNDEDYTDYSIPLKEILAGKVKDFQFTHSEPGAAYVWSKGNWVAASTIAEQNPVAFNWHWNSYAVDYLQNLSK